MSFGSEIAREATRQLFWLMIITFGIGTAAGAAVIYWWLL